MTTPDQVLGATGLLADFNSAGVVAPADVHAARLIGDLWAEPDESVRLAIALLVRALRSGSVCLDVTRLADQVIATLEAVPEELAWPDREAWVAAVRRSPAVATGTEPGLPVRLVGDLLYLERWWRTEETVRRELDQRSVETRPLAPLPRLRRELDALFDDPGLPPDEPPHQRLAAAMTALNQVTVVAGGPGTGKTTVVAKILALHEALHDVPPVVALAAPTGKAAARLEEAVRRSVDELPTPWAATAVPEAVTLHRLLGVRPGQATARHTPDNPLPHELVVVDEMSMVSLSQMALLLRALRPQARLVLVGDPDQLTPVDAGAVLADITRAVPPAPERMLRSLAEVADRDRPAALPTGAGVATLGYTWRFQGGIGRLARAIRSGDAEAALDVLLGDAEDVRLVDSGSELSAANLAAVRDQVVDTGREMHAAAESGDARKAIAALEKHRVLCAHRTGPFGVARWERLVQDWLRAAIPGFGPVVDLYPGLPIMVTENDPDVGLFNGDTGVIVRSSLGLRAAFARGGVPRLHTPLELNAFESVHAMTVHKSQGSQFRRVTLVLPPVESPLLTRELVYTAITRASAGVEVIGTPEAFARAVTRPADRASGLGRQRPGHR